MTHPVTVVDDTDGVLAVVVSPGSPFTFPDHPFGPHPWSAYQQWFDTTALHLHRDGDPYSAWKMFRDGVFDHWYLNLEAPFVRHPDGTGGGSFDTDDHGLDIVVPADGSKWRWKDLDDPTRWPPPAGSPPPKPPRSTATATPWPSCCPPTRAGGPPGTAGTPATCPRR